MPGNQKGSPPEESGEFSKYARGRIVVKGSHQSGGGGGEATAAGMTKKYVFSTARL